MANSLSNYNPIFYAQQGLIQLENALGMSARVYRVYEEERRRFGKGQLVNITRPGTFTAQDAPSTAQDITPDEVQLNISSWKEVKYAVRDDQLTWTGERYISEHIRPAAYAIANKIDQDLCALYKGVPNVFALNAAPGSVVADVTGPHRILFDNQVPMDDESFMHYMVDGELQAGLLSNSAFSQWQGAGSTGEQTQLRGSMGLRFGLNFFANQNVQAHTAGALTGSPITDGALAVGDTTIELDAGSLTGTVKEGDTFVISGNSQRFAVAADATASGNAITITIKEPIKFAVADGTSVTFTQATSTAENLVFHRNAFALAMADLPDTIPERGGADVATATSEDGSLSIRATQWYEGGTRQNYMALDAIYAVGLLDGDLACRAYAT